MKDGSRRISGVQAGVVWTIFASLLLLFLVIGKNPEVLLTDDNRVQWQPVIEKAYEDFLSNGRIYCYDFYQMRGMSVAKQGYYSVMNPFMLVSFVAAKLLPGHMSAISFYIILMVVLGNVFCYLCAERLGCKGKQAFLIAMAYSVMGCFWAFCYWYYIFNNYLIIPLLLYVFIRCRKGVLAYCAPGVVLAMSLFMGNVQYTFFQAVIFFILCMGMVVLKEGKYFKILCSNAAVSIFLSLPMLLLLMQAAGEFEQRALFYNNPIFLVSVIIHSMIPQGMLNRWGKHFTFLGSCLMERTDNMTLYMGIVANCLCVFGIVVLCQCVNRLRQCKTQGELWEACKEGYHRAADWPYEKKFVAGCTAALFFFLSFLCGGAMAKLLYVMPVVQNFRHLFKAVYAAVPLAILLFARMMGAGSIAGCVKKALWLLTIIFTLVGIANARDTIMVLGRYYPDVMEKGFDGEKQEALQSLETANVDYKNFRTAAFIRFSGIHDEHFHISENLSRNFPTAIGVFSLAAYENAVSKEQKEVFDAVYTDQYDFFMFSNAGTMRNLELSLLEEPEKVERQLTEQSVRYLLLDKSSLEGNKRAQELTNAWIQKDLRAEIVAALDARPGLSVERVCPFNEHYDLVELSGVNSLCVDEAGHMVPLTDENMQTLSFDAQAGQDYILSFAWDPHLEAFVTEADGIVTPLPVEETENGNIRISTTQSAGRVMLTWHDPLCTAGFVWEGVTMILFFGMIVTIAFARQK